MVKRASVEQAQARRDLIPQIALKLDPTAVPASLNQLVEDVASNFLLGTYIPGSYFDYLPALYLTNHTQVLTSAVNAVGLVRLSLEVSRPELRNQAQKHFVHAVSQINQALQDVKVAATDDLLASILLLSLYETLTSGSETNVELWTAHIHGALALVAQRGHEQFETECGVQMFKQIGASIRISCLRHATKIPQQLLELTELAQPYILPTDIYFLLPLVGEPFADLRADMAAGILSEPHETITRTKEVIWGIDQFISKLPSDCFYDTIFIHGLHARVFGDYYYRFKDHCLTRMWVTIWLGKLYLWAIIHEQSMMISETSSPFDENTASTMAQMRECQHHIIEAITHICASVPQLFNLAGEGSGTRLHTCPAAMSYFMIWPLFTAGSSPFIKPSMKEYILSRLQDISKDFKLPQAYNAAQMLLQGDTSRDWMHVYHVI